ncbi:hypothetical protein OIY81_853 [Cryptosporidium canis]|nr:hypothetical protein OIY81_853 [Cryptosporidium canis]
MTEQLKSSRRLNPSLKSVKLLNRPLKGKNNVQDELDSIKAEEINPPGKVVSPIKGVLKPKRKNINTVQDSNIKPPPSEIAVFGNTQIPVNSSAGLNSNLPEALLAEAIKNNRIKLPGYLDLPGKLSKDIDKGVAGLTPGVSTDLGRIHDNLDRLKDEFCRFIDFKYHASTIGNTDLEQRVFLRNSFENLKEVDYPTIKMQQWNEYQNLLLEQKKNLLLFQKSRGGSQQLDDAWCQTDEHSFDEFINNNIKLKFEKLKEIKMKRLALKRRLYLKGYFDITDFDDIEQIYDDNMLSKLGLDNQFVNDSSEDELDNIMDFVEKMDSDGRIEYNNYQVRQILSVFDKKFKRKCKPDYYQFFFGYLDYEKEKKDKETDLYKLCESERVPKELKLKLVDFLDKKLSWTEIETPWEWERDFAIDEMNPLKRGTSKIRLSDMDSSLLKKGVPNEFLQELTEIRKEYRRELLDNSLRIYEMEGVSRNISDNLSIRKEFMKNEIYGNERNHNKEFIKKLQLSDYDNDIPICKIKEPIEENNLVRKVRFKNEPYELDKKCLDEKEQYNIIFEGDDKNKEYADDELLNSLENKSESSQASPDTENNSLSEDEVVINLSRLILTKGVSDELRKDLSKHLGKILQQHNRKSLKQSSSSSNKDSTVTNKNLFVSKVSTLKSKQILSSSKQFTGLGNVNISGVQEKNKNTNESIIGKDKNQICVSSENLEHGKGLALNWDIDQVENKFNILRGAAGILNALSELEHESNLVNNHDKLKKMVSEKVGNSEFDLDTNEIKELEDGVESIIKDILDKRSKEKKPRQDHREPILEKVDDDVHIN